MAGGWSTNVAGDAHVVDHSSHRITVHSARQVAPDSGARCWSTKSLRARANVDQPLRAGRTGRTGRARRLAQRAAPEQNPGPVAARFQPAADGAGGASGPAVRVSGP